jgi:hypothetical protein
MDQWAVPGYSRNQVDRAGNALRSDVMLGDEALWVYRVVNN